MAQAINKYAHGYEQSFGVNIHNFISLPALAQGLSLKYYDETSAPIYSFGKNFGWLNEQIRQQLTGGMCMVFKVSVCDFFL